MTVHHVCHSDRMFQTGTLLNSNTPTSLDSFNNPSHIPNNPHQTAAQDDVQTQRLPLPNHFDPGHALSVPDPQTHLQTPRHSPRNQSLNSPNHHRSYQNLPPLHRVTTHSHTLRNANEWRTHLSPPYMSPVTQSKQPYIDDELPRNMNTAEGQVPLTYREAPPNWTESLNEINCQQNYLGKPGRRINERQCQIRPLSYSDITNPHFSQPPLMSPITQSRQQYNYLDYQMREVDGQAPLTQRDVPPSWTQSHDYSCQRSPLNRRRIYNSRPTSPHNNIDNHQFFQSNSISATPLHLQVVADPRTYFKDIDYILSNQSVDLRNNLKLNSTRSEPVSLVNAADRCFVNNVVQQCRSLIHALGLGNDQDHTDAEYVQLVRGLDRLTVSNITPYLRQALLNPKNLREFDIVRRMVNQPLIHSFYPDFDIYNINGTTDHIIELSQRIEHGHTSTVPATIVPTTRLSQMPTTEPRALHNSGTSIVSRTNTTVNTTTVKESEQQKKRILPNR